MADSEQTGQPAELNSRAPNRRRATYAAAKMWHLAVQQTRWGARPSVWAGNGQSDNSNAVDSRCPRVSCKI